MGSCGKCWCHVGDCGWMWYSVVNNCDNVVECGVIVGDIG